jgi:hypothetical protein
LSADLILNTKNEDKVNQLIGEIVGNISMMESMISFYLCDLIDIMTPVPGGLIIAQYNLDKKIGLLKKLVRFRFANQINFIDKNISIIKSCNKLRDTRNTYVHHLFQSYGHENVIFYDTKWREVNNKYLWSFYKKEVIKRSELKKYIKDLKQHNVRLWNLRIEGKHRLLCKDHIVVNNSDAL